MSFSNTVQNFYQEGINDEDMVMESTMRVFGGYAFHSTKNEDCYSHIDFFWSPAENSEYKVGFDVKGRRKNSRSDSKYSCDVTWIEVQNVTGRNGWIYGQAKYISFVTDKDILYVDRTALVSMYDEKVNKSLVKDSIPSNCYELYQRKGRKDLIFKARIEDIRNISKYVVPLQIN
jgi:hypothetical protein